VSVKRETVRPRAIFLAPIRLYQRFVSPALPRRCKYYPTCSAYAVDAIRELGVLRGLVVAAWRLLRCNPFSHGGHDPIENRTLFRASIPLESSAPARERSGTTPATYSASRPPSWGHRCSLAPASGSSGSVQGASEWSVPHA